MKLLGSLLRLILFVALCGLVVAGLTFLPPVQTWLAEREFAKNPDVHVSLGSIWARFGKVDFDDLRIELPHAVFTLPHGEAELPVIKTAREKTLSFQRLTAKGWTLDFTDPAILAAATSDSGTRDTDRSVAASPSASVSSSAPTESAAHILRGVFSGWLLPYDFSARAIDLEGDVVMTVGPDKTPARFHVRLQGSDLAVGHQAALTMEIEAAFPTHEFSDFSAKGPLAIHMDTPRSVDRIQFQPAFTVVDKPLPSDLTAILSLARENDSESYHVDALRNNHPVLTLDARHAPNGTPMQGTWKVALTERDLEGLPFPPVLQSFRGSGSGEFAWEEGTSSVALSGHFSTDAAAGGKFWEPLVALGGGNLDTHFSVHWTGDEVKVETLDAGLSAPGPIARVTSLQPFVYHRKTREVTLERPNDEWAELTATDVSLANVVPLPAPWRFTSGKLSGSLVLRSANNGFTLRSKAPVVASDVTATRDGDVLLKDVDISVAFNGETASSGAWQFQFAPISVSRAGKPFGSLELKAASSPDPRRPLKLTGKWSADLDLSRDQPGFAGLRELGGRSASGDFVATLGPRPNFTGHLKLEQQDAAHSIVARFDFDLGRENTVVFSLPLKISAGSRLSDFSVDGMSSSTPQGRKISMSLTGSTIDFESVRFLAGPVAHWLGVPAEELSTEATTSRTNRSDTSRVTPFWGDIVGGLSIAAERMVLPSTELQEVRGKLTFDRTTIRLSSGQFQTAGRQLGAAEGTIVFDPTAPSHYRLTGTFDDGSFDAEPLFGAPPAGEDPPFHGKLSVAGTFAGEANTLAGLLAHSEQRFHLKSTSGIVRFLKTHVAGVRREKESSVGNAADVVGSLFGKLAGVKPNSIITGQVQLGKATEAVLNFSYQAAEIGYTDLTIDATRATDGSIHVSNIDLVGTDEHISGTADIAAPDQQSLVRSSLSAELKMAVRGETAGLLAATGLLSTDKDEAGFTVFKNPFHVGGTLQKVDVTAWHDLLFAAATRNAETKKP